ncbi:MAG: ankyrin repeat domain-containing protein [Pyrinomonadaceae bacterium]
MRQIQRIFIGIVFALPFVLVSSSAANAQGAVSYRFLEVVDYANKPVPDATVKVQASCESGEQKTNEKGQLEKGLPIGLGDCHTDNFSISKNGYFSFPDYFGIISNIYSREPIRIELLKIPETRAERRAVGNEQTKREFFIAARKGDAESVRKFLKTGLSPNLTTSDLRGVPAEKDVSVFVFAVSSGDGETVKAFLSSGVNARKFPDILAIYLTANSFARHYPENEIQRKKSPDSFEDGVESLIKAGADINAPRADLNTPSGRFKATPLMLAADGGYARAVKLLIDKGAFINAQDIFGRTALIYAANSSQPTEFKIIDFLLKAGADPNIVADKESGGYTPDCSTALMVGAGSSNVESVRLLIEHKTDVNLACRNGDAPINYAVRSRRIAVVKTLLEAGADAKGEQGSRALKYLRKNPQNFYDKDNINEIIKLLEAA